MSVPPGALVQRTNSNNDNTTQQHPTQENQEQEEHQYGQQRRYPEQHRTTSKPLNFKKAMDDFQTMFPEIDRHAIESVLRANNGVVQSTIDQLLILQESCAPGVPAHDEDYELGDLPSYESSICNGEEPPPAYSAVWEETAQPHQPPPPPPLPSQHHYQDSTTTTTSATMPTPVLNREESIKKQSLLFANSRWNAPLVGELPPDFLRIEADHSPPSLNNLRLNNTRRSSPSSSASFSPLHSYPGSNHRPIVEKPDMSEDEKLAVYLQNEEFLHELRRNQEFVSSLEADHRRAVMSSATPATFEDDPDRQYVEPVSAFTTAESVSSGGARPRTAPQSTIDDVAFRQKLRHMGKSTKKKFSKMAKRFSRRNSGNRPQFLHASDSTFNLLENNDEGDYSEEGLLGIHEEEDTEDIIDENALQNNSHGLKNSYGSSPSSRQLPKVPGSGNRRQLPQPGGGNTYEGPAGTTDRTGEQGENVEPIVFYSEDNEFAYKNE